MLVPGGYATAQRLPIQFPRNNITPYGPYAIDGTYMLGEKEMDLRKRAAQIGPVLATGVSSVAMPATIGEGLTITVSDLGLGTEYAEEFVVVMNGTHGIILVEKKAYDNYDEANHEYVFPNPFGCFRLEDRISTAQLEYLLEQFDTVIYPTNTSVFGEPLPRGDEDEAKKTWILIHNIRDESYYYGPSDQDDRCDPETFTYIAGYFSASEDTANNKNMIHIDSGDWERRIGPGVEFPYMYETVFAHEFEHLLHFDRDPDESLWIDEGLANLAAFLCGYGHQAQFIAYYLVFHPITSLTYWGGGLQDYGSTYLFALYLYEHFGGTPFISALVQEQANGIEGIEKALTAFGYHDTFDEIFDNWTIANYLDDTRKKGGKYGYENLEIGSIDTWGYSIEYALSNLWWGPPNAAPFSVPSNWFYGIEPQPYTAHYFRFNNKKAAQVSIDGDDFAGILDNGFGVTTIDTKWVPTAIYPEPAGNNAMQLHNVSTLTVDPDTQAGEDRVSATPSKSGRVKVSIVTNHADHILPSHYDFGVK